MSYQSNTNIPYTSNTGSLNQTYDLTPCGECASQSNLSSAIPSILAQTNPLSTQSTFSDSSFNSGYSGSGLSQGTGFSQGVGLTQGTGYTSSLSQGTGYTSSLSQGTGYTQGTSFQGLQQGPYQGTTGYSNIQGQNFNALPQGQNIQTQQSQIPPLPNPDIELKKRMLDKHRDLKMKEAEMETNKEKKLEEKAEKQREKAVKWVSRGIAPSMASRHEVKADKLEQRAHEHHMKAEGYKLEAKQLEIERKAYDPPKEDKKGKPGQSTSKSSAVPKAAEVKKDDLKKDEPAKQETKKTETTTTQKADDVAQKTTVEKKVEQPLHSAPQTGSSTA